MSEAKREWGSKMELSLKWGVQFIVMLIVLVVSRIVMKKMERSKEEIKLVSIVAVLMTLIPILVGDIAWPLIWD